MIAVLALLALQEFSSGDLYVASNSLTIGGAWKPGISRVDPFTGSTILVREVGFVNAKAVFDPFRRRLLVRSNPTPSSPDSLWAYDSLGNATDLTPGGLPYGSYWFCAGEAGRIYMTNYAHELRYLDASNAIHDVLDAAGTGPFTFATLPTNSIRAMHFDASTQSILVSWNGANVCGGVFSSTPYVTRVPIAAGGTQAAGPESTTALCLAYDGAPGGGDAFVSNGFSPGPGGKLFLSFDNNSYVQSGRMVLLDPATLGWTTFATTTPFFGSPSVIAGCYSSALGRAVLLDSLTDVLRAFSAGDVGEGTPLASGGLVSSIGGSGELTQLVEIPFGIFGGIANYGAGTPGCAGPQVMGANSAPVANAPNFRLTTTACPASSLGLILVADAADAVGSDPFGIGILLLLNLATSTQLIPVNAVSNSFGFGASTIALSIPSSLIGATYYAQSIWAWSGCTTPSIYGLSSSNGLAITVQP